MSETRRLRHYRCHRCGRRGERGFWRSLDPGLRGTYCTDRVACKRRADEAKRKVEEAGA